MYLTYSIHDLIKPRNFDCVDTGSRRISSVLIKFSVEIVKFCHGKL